MPIEIPIYQVDAFTAEAFGGNPAAVCPLEAWPADALLQAIAAENNLSETAFLVREGDGYHIRWFTPSIEVDLCGHATLASAYVIANHIEPGIEAIRFRSRSGPLDVTRADDLYTLDFPTINPEPVAELDAVAEALGTRPEAVLAKGKVLAVFRSEAEVSALAPDLPKVAALDYAGVIATAPGDKCDFVSRFFAPHAGIPEDPVTGSAHCLLTPYWAKRLGKTEMEARQISARGGALQVADRGERIHISGRVAPYLEGRIRV